MKVRRAFGVFALVMYGMTTGMHAQQQQTDLSKPKVPLVSVVGCATQMSDGTWMLTKATEGVESKVLFMGAKEIEEAKTKPLGNNQYKATGQLQNGRKLLVKGLLITVSNEKRLNLVSVQQLADTCK